jgi:hypothetical protein
VISLGRQTGGTVPALGQIDYLTMQRAVAEAVMRKASAGPVRHTFQHGLFRSGHASQRTEIVLSGDAARPPERHHERQSVNTGGPDASRQADQKARKTFIGSRTRGYGERKFAHALNTFAFAPFAVFPFTPLIFGGPTAMTVFFPMSPSLI